MRNTMSLVAAGLLLAAAPLAAQQDVRNTSTGFGDFTVRFNDVSGDAARAQRYRDLSEGALVDRFKFDRQGGSWRFESWGDHIGRRDQRFTASFAASGRLKASFTWDQIPLFYSSDTRTPYSAAAPGVLRLDPAVRGGIESGSLTLAGLAATGTGFDLESKRHTAAFRLLYTPVRGVDVNVDFTQTRRTGTIPWLAAFGFNDAVEVSAPVDTRTNDLNAGAEWSNARGMLRVGYAGSWFDNQVPALVWDNPLKATDSTFATAYSTGLGGSTGQEALWPSNDRQGITTTGSLALPGRSRFTGSVTTEVWRQNAPLLPVTTNTAIDPIALPRPTAEADARTLAMNYSFTSRPAPLVWLNARYRYYQFDNRTPVFEPEQWVVMDQVVRPGEPTHPYGYTRHNIDVDASLTPVPFTALHVGYSRAADDRQHRVFERTAEDTYRASVDTSSMGMVTVRGIYEHSVRRGSGLDEELLVEIGEQPAMRHFDIADRNRDRVTGLVQFTPVKALGLSASLASGKDDYVDSGFGLRNNQNRGYTFTADLTPSKTVAATVSYAHERYTALQNSRNASILIPEQLVDPRRNWATDSADQTNTLSGSVDLLDLLPRIEIRLAYDRARSHATYVYRVPADTALAPLLPLPPVRNELTTATADVRYRLWTNVAVAVVYFDDRYTVDDFATSPTTLGRLALPGSLFLGSLYRPYVARTGSVRLIYSW
jgi:MtrB/PioB family decaheme-associated outer membrane protein